MSTPVRRFAAAVAILAGHAFALTAQDHAHGPAAAEAAVRKLKVHPGLEATLFASEPMVVNPAAMDVDARGRVWCTEGANYRLFQKWGKLRPEGDRILILADTDGDGKADKQTVFYQGNEVNTALGICVLGNRVIVSCSPNMFVFEDKDGDDRADGPPKVLFTGIGGVDHDHGAHAFQFGPDGKLYFNVGNDGRQLQTPDGKWVVDKAGNEVRGHRKPYNQGLALRCNLDGSEVEVLGWNFRNNFELTTDSFGTIWQSDNDDDGNQGVRINYVMEFGNYGYKDEVTGAHWTEKRTGWETEIPKRHWHLNDPGVVPNLLQTGAGSPTGIAFYEGALLPADLHKAIIHCDAGPRVVRAYVPTKSGAGYDAKIVNILEAGPDDTWFRPSDVVVAPDGSLFVTDWNDAGVGGHHMADQKLETMTGRVIRVAPKGSKPSVPDTSFKTARLATAALGSPNNATRYLAWTALHAMGNDAEKSLRSWFVRETPEYRARTLQLLARMPKKGDDYLAAAFKDKSDDVRITAIRITRELGKDVIPVVKRLIDDPSPQVRRECAIALRHSKSPEAPALWAKLAMKHDGKDRWYLEALGIGADKNWDAYLGAWLTANGGEWKSAAAKDVIWRSRSSKTAGLLVKIIKDPGTPAAERDRYMRSMDFLTGPEKEEALLQLLTAN
jgi:putative membrane-bound dehydrogenase-like protein